MNSVVDYLCEKIKDDKVVLNLCGEYILNFDRDETKIETITVDNYVYNQQALKINPEVTYTKNYIHNSLHFYNYNNGEELRISLFLDKNLEALQVTVSSCDGTESFYWIK